MTKKDFIKRLANKAGTTIKEAEKFFEAFSDTMLETFLENENIRMPKLGIFKVVTTKERKGYNPATGEEITIPARKQVKFKQSEHLKKVMKLEKSI